MNRAIRVGVLLILFVSAALSTPQQKATRVLVLKKEHKMQLYGGESVINTYTVAIGRGGLAPKQRQDDHLTPEGLYEIDRRNKNSRFYRALHVSYPNAIPDAMNHDVTSGVNAKFACTLPVSFGFGLDRFNASFGRLDRRLHSSNRCGNGRHLESSAGWNAS